MTKPEARQQAEDDAFMAAALELHETGTVEFSILDVAGKVAQQNRENKLRRFAARFSRRPGPPSFESGLYAIASRLEFEGMLRAASQEIARTTELRGNERLYSIAEDTA